MECFPHFNVVVTCYHTSSVVRLTINRPVLFGVSSIQHFRRREQHRFVLSPSPATVTVTVTLALTVTRYRHRSHSCNTVQFYRPYRLSSSTSCAWPVSSADAVEERGTQLGSRLGLRWHSQLQKRQRAIGTNRSVGRSVGCTDKECDEHLTVTEFGAVQFSNCCAACFGAVIIIRVESITKRRLHYVI